MPWISPDIAYAVISLGLISLIGLVAFIAICMVSYHGILWIYRKSLAHRKVIAATQADIAKNEHATQQINDLTTNNRLVAQSKFEKARASLRKMEMWAAPTWQLDRESKMKAQGVLAQVAQTVEGALDYSKRIEDRYQIERDQLQTKITTLHDKNAEMANQVSLLTIRQEKDQAEIRILNKEREELAVKLIMQKEEMLKLHAAEKEMLLTQAASEKEVLLGQIADLRSHLSASESTTPVMHHLMNIAKALDDVARAQTVTSQRLQQLEEQRRTATTIGTATYDLAAAENTEVPPAETAWEQTTAPAMDSANIAPRRTTTEVLNSIPEFAEERPASHDGLGSAQPKIAQPPKTRFDPD